MKCPECGWDGAYVGFTAVECVNPACKHFKIAIDMSNIERLRKKHAENCRIFIIPETPDDPVFSHYVGSGELSEAGDYQLVPAWSKEDEEKIREEIRTGILTGLMIPDHVLLPPKK